MQTCKYWSLVSKSCYLCEIKYSLKIIAEKATFKFIQIKLVYKLMWKLERFRIRPVELTRTIICKEIYFKLK